MIILPDRNIPRARFLMPVHDRQWSDPSQAVPRDQIGNPVEQTRFRVRAKTHDGVTLWTGWFESREDFDAFLWAIARGTLPQEHALWNLPSPMWPGLEPGLLYAADTVTFLSTTGSNQTYNKPADWSDDSNSVQCLGGGGSGGASSDAALSFAATGGTGGAYAKITNFVFSSASLTYRVGSGGAAVVRSTSGQTAGNAGGVTYWNASADPGVGTDNSKCSAANGLGGKAFAGEPTATAGGQASASWGQTKWNGGGSGSATGGAVFSASGGGGAAGDTGAGGTSSNAAGNTTTAGGAGGATGGGSSGSTNGGNGGNGTNFDATHGAGGGGGGAQGTGNRTGGSGGNYGSGGGGAAAGGTATSGAGKQGLIVVTYTPKPPGGGFNQISLGM